MVNKGLPSWRRGREGRALKWRGRLPLWGTAVAYVVFVLFVYAAVRARDRVVDAWRARPRRGPAPQAAMA